MRDAGPKTAPAVILLHGFGASLQTWEAWAQALSTDYRVIRFDLPCIGLSWPDPAGDYSDERSMQLLIALMDRLGVPRARLVGNDLRRRPLARGGGAGLGRGGGRVPDAVAVGTVGMH